MRITLVPNVCSLHPRKVGGSPFGEVNWSSNPTVTPMCEYLLCMGHHSNAPTHSFPMPSARQVVKQGHSETSHLVILLRAGEQVAEPFGGQPGGLSPIQVLNTHTAPCYGASIVTGTEDQVKMRIWRVVSM